MTSTNCFERRVGDFVHKATFLPGHTVWRCSINVLGAIEEDEVVMIIKVYARLLMKITMGYRRQKKEHDELMILSSWDRDIGLCVKHPLLSCFTSNASRSSYFSSPSPGRSRLEGFFPSCKPIYTLFSFLNVRAKVAMDVSYDSMSYISPLELTVATYCCPVQCHRRSFQQCKWTLLASISCLPSLFSLSSKLLVDTLVSLSYS